MRAPSDTAVSLGAEQGPGSFLGGGGGGHVEIDRRFIGALFGPARKLEEGSPGFFDAVTTSMRPVTAERLSHHTVALCSRRPRRRSLAAHHGPFFSVHAEKVLENNYRGAVHGGAW